MFQILWLLNVLLAFVWIWVGGLVPRENVFFDTNPATATFGSLLGPRFGVQIVTKQKNLRMK